MEKSSLKDITTIVNYLKVLKLSMEPPSYDFLARICNAHLNTFPFENISKLLLFQKGENLPEFKSFIENFQRYNFGGTCYVLNSNLLILLKGLGFDCYHVMLGDEHIAIMVVIDNIKYYVDCGAAAPIFKPVDFENNIHNLSQFGDDKVQLLSIDPSNHMYRYIRFRKDKQVGSGWEFNSVKKFTLQDFKDAISKSYAFDAPFMDILRCQKWQTDRNRSLSIVNNRFTITYSNGDTELYTLSTINEIERVIAEEFFLPKLPVARAVEILKTRNIDIFSE